VERDEGRSPSRVELASSTGVADGAAGIAPLMPAALASDPLATGVMKPPWLGLFPLFSQPRPITSTIRAAAMTVGPVPGCGVGRLRSTWTLPGMATILAAESGGRQA
jgi:hypothetical protein